MYLRKIEINGFKSFANKTEIFLNDKITGVVGPNGSGKSNIADAIRWVLGEQSSKNLRGAKMEDVIFGGTEARPRKAYAEVSLVFENSDGRADIEYSELTITRKMYRSGESEYYLNRAAVRLKDIIDLMRDTGIGKEGYSIIGQGKIDEILENRPTARRKVFEEAAGIMKFRARKEEAERKLEKTEENISRIDDILSELREQLGPLCEQAKQAKEYQSLYSRQRIVDANLFLYNNVRFENRIQKLNEELSDIASELAELQKQTGDSSEESTRLSDRLNSIILEKNALSEQIERFVKSIEQTGGSIAVAEERKASAFAETERTDAQREEKLALIQKLKAQTAELVTRRSETEAEKESLRVEYEGVLSDINDIDSTLDEKRSQLFAEKDRIESISRNINEGKNELSALSAHLEAAEKSLSGILERIDALQKESAEKNLTAIEEKRLYNRSRDEMQSVASQINEKKFKLNEIKSQRQTLESEAESIGNALAKARSEKQLLQELKEEYDGYSQSVRALMRIARTEPDIKRLIRGTFAELIKVPAKYETAIETVLGNTLQNVIVDTEEDAKQIIEFLRRRNLGRVTFMPLNALKVNRLTDKERSTLTDSGFISVASDVIEHEDYVTPAIEFALARTVLVKDMDSAIRVMRSGDYAFRALTLDGDFIRPGGVMTGGSTTSNKIGLLSRDHRIAAAEERIKKALADKEKHDALMRSIDGEASALSSAAQSLTDELSKMEISAAERRERLNALTDSIDANTDAEAQLNAEYSQIQERIEELKAKKLDNEQKQSELSERAESAKKAEEDFMRSEDDRLGRRKALSERLSELKIRSAEIAKDTQALDANIDRLTAEETNAKESFDILTDTINDLQTRIAALDEENKKAQEHKAGLESELLKLRTSYDEKEAERLSMNELVQKLQQSTSDSRSRQTELIERRYKTEAQIEKTTLLKEHAQQKLWEDHELTYALAEELKTEINYTTAARESDELKTAIRDLGPINPNAIEDCARVSARETELSGQREDLVKAKDDLTEVIVSLLSSMRVTFREKFELLNTHFKRIFTDLFGGGRAQLTLGEGDVLEAGIDISAEPPGKKLQQLSLLSGGERALTAIALLFSMISINPSPVCLFDEIDAPLDEANARLFSEYLKRIENTQFVVITHRKPTMALCDSLYGVAMQEKGVSTLVSVSLKK